MNSDNKTEQNVLEMLKSDDPVLKTETLYNLSFEEVDNNIVKIVIQLISDEDKSVRNAASNFLIQNSNPLIPASVIDFIFMCILFTGYC